MDEQVTELSAATGVDYGTLKCAAADEADREADKQFTVACAQSVRS